MIAYLDTHIVQWLVQGDIKHLSGSARRIIETADLLVSPMVPLEFDFLYEINRTKLRWRDVQAELLYELGIRVCDLPFNRIAYVALDETWTRDPFDRIIVAHAKANGLADLISADEAVRKNYQRAVW